MKPSGWLISKRLRDCEKLRITIYELRFTRKQEKSKIVDPKSEIRESRSSVWLEHYTDNVGVSSSNLLGSTKGSEGWKEDQEAARSRDLGD